MIHSQTTTITSLNFSPVELTAQVTPATVDSIVRGVRDALDRDLIRPLPQRITTWMLPEVEEGSSMLADVVLDVVETPEFLNVARVCLDVVEQRAIAALNSKLFPPEQQQVGGVVRKKRVRLITCEPSPQSMPMAKALTEVALGLSDESGLTSFAQVGQVGCRC